MDIKKLYIIGIVVVILVICIICFIVLKQKKHKQLAEKLEELERQRNLIVATPVITELDKVKVIINNSELEKKYKGKDSSEDQTKKAQEMMMIYQSLKNSRSILKA